MLCLDADDAKEMLTWDYHAGFSVDASVQIADTDREGLARLTRYCARHPFAKGRLGSAGPERVVYQLPKPDVHGNTELALSPLELLDRLAQFITPPAQAPQHLLGLLRTAQCHAPLRRPLRGIHPGTS